MAQNGPPLRVPHDLADYLPDNLARFAGLHRVSQRELAEFVGLSRQGVSNLFRAFSHPSMGTLQRLAWAFSVTPNDLLADTETALRAAVAGFATAPIHEWQVGEWTT